MSQVSKITIMGVNLADEYEEERKRRDGRQRVRWIAAQILHMWLTEGKGIEQRRAWNSWTSFVAEEQRKDADFSAVLDRKLYEYFGTSTQKLKQLRRCDSSTAMIDDVRSISASTFDSVQSKDNGWKSEHRNSKRLLVAVSYTHLTLPTILLV